MIRSFAAVLPLVMCLAGCPFSPEDLELTAGSPPPGGGAPGAMGPGGASGGDPGAGGPMGEPALGDLIAELTQDDVQAGAHVTVTGVVVGDCPAAVRIDALNGRPGGGGSSGAKRKTTGPGAEPGGPPTGGEPGGPPPGGEPGGPPPGGEAGGPPPGGEPGGPPPGGEPGGPPPGGDGGGPRGGGGGGGAAHGPITTHHIDRAGAFVMVVPTGRSLRLSAFCDGDGDGYLTQAVDRISPPAELGTLSADRADITLTLEPPRMPDGAGAPGGPSSGAPPAPGDGAPPPPVGGPPPDGGAPAGAPPVPPGAPPQ